MGMEASDKKWYVYLLCDPDTEQPFYVGKGTGYRMYLHERDNINPAKHKVIHDLHSQGKQVLKKKVAEFSIESDAYLYEWALINLYHEQITNTQPWTPRRWTRERALPQMRHMDNDGVSRWPLLTVSQAAQRLQETDKFVVQEIIEKRLRAYQIGTSYRLENDDISIYLREYRKTG